MIKKLKKAELKQFEKRLLEEREKLLKELEYESGQISKTQLESSGDLSAYSNHMADQGTETERREITSQILSTRREALFEIDLALKKINQGKYGFCEACGKPIGKKRLKFLPQARKCIKCSRETGR
ncbi:MAG TPA: TraR/DksA family transcriptional regulator [candidate division WOR-3 bacterium]|uniref:TraR/DksA family transcriptional regulator n=1 Tax=candidate division WOR-3 bacterium TaxID=2052148 RepID=A0A9C9K0J9_UNCW3|nr:TraR/DksA family transcriptional regulator [candidate division WOR-3 bacterium]